MKLAEQIFDLTRRGLTVSFSPYEEGAILIRAEERSPGGFFVERFVRGLEANAFVGDVLTGVLVHLRREVDVERPSPKKAEGHGTDHDAT